MKYLGKIENEQDIVNKEYVDNKIYEETNLIELGIDTTIIENSSNVITSGAVYNAPEVFETICYSEDEPEDNIFWYDTSEVD